MGVWPLVSMRFEERAYKHVEMGVALIQERLPSSSKTKGAGADMRGAGGRIDRGSSQGTSDVKFGVNYLKKRLW